MTLVSHLESINLSATDIDVKGFAFEKFMDGFFKGSYGQYFTPRELIKFIVDMMNPTRDSLILDPACGSGGFLLHVFDKIREQANEYADKGTADHNNYWSDFARSNLFGIEINENIAQVAKMNMIIHGDGHTNVACADSLQPFETLKQKTKNDSFDKEKFDFILTNPPFGSNINSSEYPFIKGYELGKSTSKSGKTTPRKNQKSEVLFIERCLEFLKKGTGKMAIILPDGVLSNSSMQYVRDYLMEKTQILGIVSFPQLAFKQYGAGVKSSVIFCRKKADFEGETNYKIFMAIAENVGYDSTGRKTTENDLDMILEEYRKQHG